MSVHDRIEDARLLYSHGRSSGALLSVLIAVAATSRKRYPRPVGDRVAFTRFIGEEMSTISFGMLPNYATDKLREAIDQHERHFSSKEQIDAAWERYFQARLAGDHDIARELDEQLTGPFKNVKGMCTRFRDRLVTLDEFLYEHVRCMLAHEAELPADVAFEPLPYLKFACSDGRFVLSDKLIEGLIRAVVDAPENRSGTATACDP